MPRIILTVPETIQSVMRPIVLDIARQVFEVTGIDEKTPIFFPGETEKTFQPGSSIANPGNDVVNFPFYERVSIDVVEEYEADRLMSTAIYRPENKFLFRDDSLETYIKPAYSSQLTTINFKYRSRDKTRAMKWRDDIRARVAIMRELYMHQITYHYLIPPQYLVILNEIHRMREKVAGYGDDYEKYFREHITPHASLLSNMSGSKEAWGISETQARIVGRFDFEGTPEEGAKEDEGSTWTITFGYKFTYDKPIACVMSYPLMIHNQLMSIKYRPSKPAYELDQNKISYSYSAKLLHHFEKGKTHLGIPEGFAIPVFDEFIPSEVLPDTMRIFTTLVSIDVNDPNYLFSMLDLGIIKLDPAIIEFMKGEAPFMTTPYNSIFTLSLYERYSLLDANKLTIDVGLDVYSNMVLNFRNYYHVRLGLVTDLNMLSPAAMERLRRGGEALMLILETLDPGMKKRGQLPKYIGEVQGSTALANKLVSRADMKTVTFIINTNTGSSIQKTTYVGLGSMTDQNKIVQFNTVESLSIIVERADNANS